MNVFLRRPDLSQKAVDFILKNTTHSTSCSLLAPELQNNHICKNETKDQHNNRCNRQKHQNLRIKSTSKSDQNHDNSYEDLVKKSLYQKRSGSFYFFSCNKDDSDDDDLGSSSNSDSSSESSSDDSLIYSPYGKCYSESLSEIDKIYGVRSKHSRPREVLLKDLLPEGEDYQNARSIKQANRINHLKPPTGHSHTLPRRFKHFNQVNDTSNEIIDIPEEFRDKISTEYSDSCFTNNEFSSKIVNTNVTHQTRKNLNRKQNNHHVTYQFEQQQSNSNSRNKKNQNHQHFELGNMQSSHDRNVHQVNSKQNENTQANTHTNPPPAQPAPPSKPKVNFIANRIDVCSRFLFPFTFLCFNLLYWGTYSRMALRDFG